MKGKCGNKMRIPPTFCGSHIHTLNFCGFLLSIHFSFFPSDLVDKPGVVL